MPIIDTPAGTLEVTNAILSASEFRATQKISVSNSAPTKNFSVGDKFHVSTTDADAVNITGNLVAHTLKIGNLLVSPTFDLAAVSNVGNTTSNTLQFANATTGFVTSSNVEIGGNITLTSNAQVKVGSNVLAEYTGPHGREPKEMPLKKFPEIAFDASKLDGNGTTNTYTQAGYTVTASSSGFEGDGFAPWKVFNQDNGKTGNNGWHTAGNPGTVSGAPYNTIDSSYVGEWLKIELPNAIKLSHISIVPRLEYASRQPPSKYRVYGSNNDSNWVELIDADNVVYAEEVFTTRFSTTTNYYKYLALVIQKGTIDTGVTIGEIQYYGTEEPAPPGDLSLDTTLKSTFNSVRSNNYVMYFDGDGFVPGDTNSNNLVENSSTSVIHHNATYDSTGKYWTLDGSTESNVTTGSLGFEGDVPHTVSMWVNSSNLDANATTQQLFSIGSGYDKAFLKVDDTQIAANTWHNVTYAYQGEGGSKVTYVDGRKVEEAQVEDTFGDYPPFAMTDYETGGYRVSASSEYATSYKAYQAFDDIVTGAENAIWLSDNFYGTNGVYTGSESTTVSGTVYSGEWLQIELPHKLKVSYVAIQPQNGALERSPLNGVIAGSNDGTTWYELNAFTGITTSSSPAWSATVPVNFALNSTNAYTYFRFVITATQSTTTYYASIQNVQLYGHKEGDLTRFPEPTRVLKYPHITFPNGNGETGNNQDETSHESYSKRGYVIKASGWIGSYPPYAAFNGEIGAGLGQMWVGGFNKYGDPPSNGSYKTNLTAANTRNLKADLGSGGSAIPNGEWLYIEMPNKLKVTSTRMISNPSDTQPPDNLVIYGTNDVSAGWNIVDNTYASSSSGIPNNLTGKTWNVSTSGSPVAYKYFAVVVTKLNVTGTTNGHVVLVDWSLYGTEEDTGTPAIVGGPFAGKVANFRVYDQYLGDERIQEIYDAQKDAFGHKKSSMTFYKGRIGVGTTEPEGALTVVDEPHALAKFPARAVSADDSYVEGDGQIKLSAADGSGYQAFDGLTSTSWMATPTRNTRLSEEVDFGAWLKIQTPESVSLKKAEIESNPYWRQVGSTIIGGAVGGLLGIACDCSRDGTRIIMGAYGADVDGTDTGSVRVYDWNGSAWSQVGNIISGTENDAYAGYDVSISGDGNIIAVAETYHDGGGASGDNRGVVSVWYLNLGQWTILPDSGALTSVAPGLNDKFVGSSAGELLGFRIKLSGDGYTLAVSRGGYSTNAGRVSVYRYVNGAWTQRGQNIDGVENNDLMGYSLDMSEDGNHLIIGAHGGTNINAFVYDYNSGTNSWDKIGGSTLAGTSSSNFGISSAISNDGSVIAVGASGDDADGNDSGRVYMYKRSGSNWTLVSTLSNPSGATDELFGTSVSLSGDGTRLVVGASYYDPPGGGTGDAGHAGKLYTFEYDGASWKLRNLNSISAIGLEAGVSDSTGAHLGQYQSINISRDGSTIIGGEYLADITLVNEGRVRVWNMPSNIKSIWGSNDDVNWTKITTGNETFRVSDRLEFKNLDNPNYYKYHAIVADAFTRLKDVKLFGVRKQGSSTLHDGTLTLTKKVTAPQLESTGIINMKGDYTEIRANSNVVTEFSRSKKFIKYPRVALTSAAETGGYQGYIVTRSSQYSSYNAWEVFDENNPVGGTTGNQSGWASTIPGNYSVSTGAWGGGGTPHHTGSTEGEWIQIQLPDSIYLHDFVIESRSETTYGLDGYDHGYPKNVVLYGSINGSSWNTIKTFTTGQKTFSEAHTENINETRAYKYFALVVNSIQVVNNTTQVTWTSIGQIRLFGVPEYDPEAYGTNVKVTSYPNVPNTDWLEVYYDAKGLENGSTTVNDLKPVGTANNGTVGGNTSVTDEAFTFDGTGDYITSTVTTGTGNQSFSVACWFKFTTLGSLLWGFTGITNGTSGSNPTNNSTPHSFFNSDGSITFDFWANSVGTGAKLIEVNRWYAGVWTYDGTTRKIYINGTQVHLPQRSAPLSIINSTSRLSIGIYPTNLSSAPMTGSVANFRLFNRAITSDEVWQLYAYQKEYFGYGDLSMTLKAGRLGIGTSEPRAMLDVRGDLKVGGMLIESNKPRFSAYSTAGDTTYSSGFASPIILEKTYYNFGSHYSTSSGAFTAPVSGYYRFSTYIWNNGAAAQGSLWYRTSISSTWDDVLPYKLLGLPVAGDETIMALPSGAGNTYTFELYVPHGYQIGFGGRGGSSLVVYRAHSYFSGELISEV